MNIIINHCNEDTRTKIALGSLYEDNLKTGELIKFLARVRTICNNTDNGDDFFGSWLTKITKHHLHPTTIVEELLLAHPTDDGIWDNTNRCDVSFDDTYGAEIAASIDVTKGSTVTTTISMPIKDDELWFDTHEEFDL